MFLPEVYNPENSAINGYMKCSAHGGLTAIIHQVAGDDESTLLFYGDEHIHTANGFHLQDAAGRGALQALVGMIAGGWSYPDAIEVIANNPRKTDKTIHYCFGPVGFFEEVARKNNLGYAVYIRTLDSFYTHGIGETVVMKDAFR